MTRKFALASVLTILALWGVKVARAQRGTGDWMTTAYDPQRSSWVRSDGKISLETMRKPGFQLYWKLKFDNASRQLNSISPPALIDFYIGYRGFRALGLFGGSSDRVFAVDVELGRLEWEKRYDSVASSAGTLPCPGGMTSAVTRPTVTGYPNFFSPRGAGRGTPAKSGVGSPDAGAVTLRPAGAPPPRRPAASGPNPYAPVIQYVLALTGDGKLHSLWLSNGNEPDPPISFLPPNARAEGLIAYDKHAYVATTSGCGGVDDGVWALDLATQKVFHWKSAPGGVAGTAGPAVRPNGTLYAAGGGGELVALAAPTLNPLGSYKTGGPAFASSPVIFEMNGKDLIAVATNDGHLRLLDADLHGPALDDSASFFRPGEVVGSLSTWRDPAGTRWILAPADGVSARSAGFKPSNGKVTNGTLVAWKVEEKDGKPALQPGWMSRDLISPLPPVIINGVIFVISSGEFRSNDARVGAAERARRSTAAVLYALDAISGQELWNSGGTMTSFVHSGGLSAGGGRIYVSDHDGVQYCFAFPMER